LISAFAEIHPPGAREAADRAQPGLRPPCNTRALGGRDLAARDRCQKSGQHLAQIRARPQ